MESRQARGLSILQFPSQPIDDDSCDFLDGLGGHEQGLGGRKEVKEGRLFPDLLWSVLGFIAACSGCHDKSLLFEQAHRARQVIGGGH